MSNAKAFGSKFIKEIKVFKIYFSIYFSILFISVSAQQIGKQNLVLKNPLSNTTSYRTNNHNSVNALTCDTLTTITRKDTLTLYTITSTVTANNGGYVTGNNNYGDSAMATFIPADTLLIPSGAQITGVIAVFYRYNNLGTNGTQTISVNIYTGDTIYGPTITTTTVMTGTVVTTTTVIAAPIGTATASLAAISAITPVSNAVDSAVIPILSSNYQIPYLFGFASPITVPDTGFFISLTLPTTVGDTVVLLCTRNDSSNVNYAWDYGVNGWRAFSNSNDWTLYTSLTLFPVICYQPVGIKSNVLETNIVCFPNPDNGEFNLAVALPEATNLTVSIISTLGETVFTKTESNISNVVLRYDLSSFGKGVYFLTITDSKNNKIIKKLVVE
jgi:type IX secretion system substrate protein